ncbi:amino acid adenylation domain-containing protein [Actinosynnema mirum]|uniref:Amino acid adenylation domain protein n=1 Tax=Actinosynnema mirum (strain ATCC 29888 / DSM 43827 / JCM 3225 / NBRC 14064 / NCIMB 13271 / NRRL B-12336 / IMRU 3971 / 101) TaxID=446462 RepID=C6WBQ4_ACTMD|nr:amino acid adenylation domain-containing protein [Actinosynnema mirum]ACU37471.1 amino acid adenylation domain protein [Actinosynnema mirum DSM 43827]
MGAAGPGGRPAVVTPDGVLTHRELETRVDRLARALVAAGVGPEVVCAIALERGVDAVVAMSAVRRAHGAFLTVDTDLPPQRVAALLSEARVLVSAAGLAERFSVPGPTVLVDSDSPDAVLPEGEPDPRSLAYVSHTSGSTGVPNAVLVEHRSLRSYLRSAVRDNDLGPDTVVLQLAPMGYDASIRDTLAPLLAGGSVVVLPRSALLRPEELFAAVRAHGVNAVLSTTPSFLTFLSRRPGAVEALRGVRLVATSGESLRPFLAAGGRALLPGRLVNQYGPTECTMTSTRHEVPAAPEDADLVGRPIEGVVVRLLDGALREVPDGAVGEVHLGGIGVARGYAGRPGLTAERFVPDPFCVVPPGGTGERLYRTGDLARRRPDGVLEYLGRDDRQIKVRGHRVDPAEVEAVLLTHPSITGAAVTPATDAQHRTYLVAHVTGEVAEVRDAALRAHLADALPPHLMPRRFTRLDRFPTTRSGKVDRAALAAGAR